MDIFRKSIREKSMTNLLEYVLGEVKNQRLQKSDAMDLLRQLQEEKPQISAALHPLLHANTSDLQEQRVSTRLSGEEFFLADHVVRGHRMLPAVVYLEMARAAVEKASGNEIDREKNGIILKHVLWAHPVIVEEEGVTVHIGLHEAESGEIHYEIYSEEEEERVLHGSGTAVWEKLPPASSVDIEGLRSQFQKEECNGSQCYELFRAIGIEYGARQRAIESLAKIQEEQGRQSVFAQINLPATVSGTWSDYVLHPSVLDAALQASIGFAIDTAKKTQGVALPFALDSLEILSQTPQRGWAIVREAQDIGQIRKLDIEVYDETGRSCIRLKGLSLRAVNEEEIEAETGTLLLEPVYVAQRTEAQLRHIERSFSQWCVILCCREFTADYQKAIEDAFPGVHCFTLQSTESGVAARFHGYAKALLEIVQELQRAKPKEPVLAQLVIPHGAGEEDLLFGRKGILQTAGMESPKIVGQVIQVEREASAGELLRKLEESRDCIGERLIRYQHGERKVLRFAEIEAGAEAAVPVWKSGGVYLITGGAGGLGLLFAKEIAHQAPGARLVLSGRSVLSREKEQELEAIAGLGA